MKKNELKKVVDFYNNVICQQIIKPVEIQEIYELVEPEPQLVPYYRKMRAISVYVQGLQQQVIADLDDLMSDFDEEQEELAAVDDPRTAEYIPKESAASPSRKLTDTLDPPQSHSEDTLPQKGERDSSGIQSHSEDCDFKTTGTISIIENEDGTMKIDFPAVEKALDEVDELTELQAAYENATTANEKRSLKMRINKIKKDGN